MKRDIVVTVEQLIIPSERTSVAQCDRMRLWDDMRDTIIHSKTGIALAAIQIGIPVRAFMVYLARNGKPPVEFRFVNPEIREAIGKLMFPAEGCLSFPGKCMITDRFNRITIVDDINGEMRFEGLMSVICQHEIDHLNGITFFDREHTDEKPPAPNELCRYGCGRKWKKCFGKCKR